MNAKGIGTRLSDYQLQAIVYYTTRTSKIKVLDIPKWSSIYVIRLTLLIVQQPVFQRVMAGNTLKATN